MSLTAAALRKMLEAGLTLEQAVEIAEALDTPVTITPDVLVRKRERDAERMRRKRAAEATSRDVATTVASDVAEYPHSPSLSPPDPPKPTPTPEKNITTQARGTRLAEGWEPDADGWAYAIEHLGSPQLAHAEADKFRDYWRAVPGAKGRKSDWPATWRNWTRRASETRPRKAHAERPHPDNRQAAREANYAAAFRGADLASRQRWEP